MTWNWKKTDWPNFRWDSEKMARCEKLFVENAGVVIGASRHLSDEDRQTVTIELMSLDAVGTSAIEGEYLDRDSIQSSIRRALGLQVSRVQSTPAESGVAEMMVSLYRDTHKPLTESLLFEWHRMVMHGRRDLQHIGIYRTHDEAMQIVSGPDYDRKVHFEAPPSKQVPKEMKVFFNGLQKMSNNLGAVTRAGIAHLWFESIHPFEDGNGRIGRAIAEKILSGSLSAPVFTILSKTLLAHKKAYYAALSSASKQLDVMDWLLWFGRIVIEAQQNTLAYIEFVIQKAKLLDRVRGQLNSRQEKVILRLFQAGPEGFIGGLSAEKYRRITNATAPTTTRDLHDLVEKNVLRREGRRKSTRYFLTIQTTKIKSVTLADIL